jgi:hypothetical protein
MRVLSAIKKILVPTGKAPRTIQGGAFKGLRMDLDFAYQFQLYIGTWERETLPWLKYLSEGIRTAVDIGADQGEHTLFFLVKTNADKVLSFEPGESSRRQLLSNLKLNGQENTSRLELSPLFVGSQFTGAFTSLDAHFAQIARPCLIKMDVDGGEAAILKGASNLLHARSVRWLIETHSVSLENECIEVLEREGFKTKIIRNAWWRIILPELRPIELNRWLVAAKPEDLTI